MREAIAGVRNRLNAVISRSRAALSNGSNVAPSFLFNRDSIISDDQALIVSRAGATAQKREHELIAIDPDQDYTAVPSLSQIPRNPMIISAAVGKETATVPLVIDASTRQALATFSQNYEENARRKVAFKVRASEYEIEPGDLFALTDIADGFDNEVFKVTQTTHGANWVVDVEGEAILRCAIFRESVPGYAVVASGDLQAGIRYCYVEGTAPQEWHGHSYMDTPGWPFSSTGAVIASSYAKVRGMPTFLMGGNDFIFIGFGNGIMMVSHDAINWTQVYSSESRRVIYNMVWDEEEGAFYADFRGPIAHGVTTPAPTTICLRSETGYVWEEVAEDFWSHTTDGKTPDGRAGHDPETGLTILPGDLDDPGSGVDIRCTAYANGVWLAGGSNASGSLTMISFDGGVNWSVSTSGSGSGLSVTNSPVYTMVAVPLLDITG